jgi:hypothetical protein
VGRIGSDPDFRALQAEEGVYVSQIHSEASLGWVEMYVRDGKTVNVSEEGKSEFLGWESMSHMPAMKMGGPPAGGPPKPEAA